MISAPFTAHFLLGGVVLLYVLLYFVEQLSGVLSVYIFWQWKTVGYVKTLKGTCILIVFNFYIQPQASSFSSHNGGKKKLGRKGMQSLT